MPHLVLVPIAKLNPNCECCKHKPGLYRIVWQLDESPAQITKEQWVKFGTHPVVNLMGGALCVN